ncbi:hypothetical protein Taro_029893 [Colocasia esculenta]|uniref:Uncharacterized protein n=1 Tax=Colocasia esculenta TaxID=4460 RepID=A0A843VMJ4_COLES|nr:hypothetical protein [Colocasia esculenta]
MTLTRPPSGRAQGARNEENHPSHRDTHKREHCSKQNYRSNISRSWENLHQNHQGTVLEKPSRTHQPNKQKQHTSNPEVAHHEKNEHGAVQRETLTRTTANGYGKPHQNIRQPSDAPQPRALHLDFPATFLHTRKNTASKSTANRATMARTR